MELKSNPKPSLISTRGPRPVALTQPRFRQAEFDRNVWAATPEQGVTLETLKEPSFWAHVAGKLKMGDRIEVLADDMSYFAEFIVLAATRTEAAVKLLRHVELSQEVRLAENLQTHKVEWSGRHTKWRVIRKSDKAVIKSGFESQQLAANWLSDHLKAVA